MSDKNLTTFLTEWGGQVKELIEPKVKLIPEFKMLDTISENDAMSQGEHFRYSYTGDGALSLSYPETSSGVMVFDSLNNNTTIYVEINGHGGISGTATVTSAETDNYEAGEWTFNYNFAYL